MIFLGAPFIEVLRGNQALHGALSAITAAVVGVVLNLAIWFAIHTMFRETWPVRGLGLSFDAPVLASVDPWALLLSAAAVDRHVPVQGRHDPDARGLLGRGRRPLSGGGDLMSEVTSLDGLAACREPCSRAVAAAQDTSFADTPLGVAPKYFESMQTGPGEPGRWEIVEDDKARADGRSPR